MITETRIASGIDTTITSVERHEPRKSRIIEAGQRRGDHRLAHDAAQRRPHEDRLVEERLDVELGRQRGLDARQRVASRAGRCRASTPSASSARSAARSGGRRRAPCWSAPRSRRAPGRRRGGRPSPPPTCFTGTSLSVSMTSGRRVGADVVLDRPNLGRAGRQDDVLTAQRARHVEGRQTLGVERIRVEVDHHRARPCRPQGSGTCAPCTVASWVRMKFRP